MSAGEAPRKLPTSLDDENFVKRLRSSYGLAAIGTARRYHDFGIQLAEYMDQIAFLSRCLNVRLIPEKYKVRL